MPLNIINKLKPLRRWKHFCELAAVIGLLPAARQHFDRYSAAESYRIRPLSIPNPIQVRTRSSDWNVFYQIFVEKEYACLDILSKVGLIVDAGANVGYSDTSR